MQLTALTTALVLCATAFALAPSTPQEGDSKAMAEMMAKAGRYTKPGEHHKVLEKFLGKWNTEMRFFMGANPSDAEKGTAECSWLMPGLFLQVRSHGQMMGAAVDSYYLLGYDNFKMSYVTTVVSSGETAMRHFEGDMTPDGKSLISYGTLDEYLTGEHDKMVKSVWRFIDADTFLLEIHDLPIGEVNTKVFEIKYTRAK